MPTYRWTDYVDVFEVGDKLTRADLATHFGVGGSTARYHLERAVLAGALNKVFGWLGGQSGWIYALPGTMPRLAGF
jgi:hypothetical protein